MVRFTIHDLAIALLALTCCVTGCQSMRGGGWKPSAIAKKLDPRDGLPWNRKDEAREGNPARIVATWSDTVLHREGQPATRGFGGKIYFYDNKDTDPIKVKGQLVVYAFDETNRVPTDNCPTRRYVFPPETMEEHESDSDLGVGYSFWLPWDGTDGPSTEVSLIARFEPLKGGALVVSDQSRTRLPGKIAPTAAPAASLIATQPGVSGVQVASGELTPQFTVEQATNLQPVTTAPLRKMQTTSISLPEGFRPSGKGLIPDRKQTPREKTQPAAALAPTSTSTSTTGAAPQTSEELVAQLMGLSPEQAAAATAGGTTVQTLTVGESVRKAAGQPTFGSRPFGRLAPTAPALQPAAAHSVW